MSGPLKNTSQSELQEKERRARDLIERRGLAGLALSTQANFAWITCGADNHVSTASETGNATALITRDAKYVICDNIEAPRILEEELDGRGFELVSFDWHEASLAERIGDLACGGGVGADSAIPGTIAVGAELAPYRASLTPEEVERYRWVGRNTAECMNLAARSIRPGMTEHEIAAVLDSLVISRGMMPNLTLVAADERIGWYRHPIPTDRKLQRCAMLVIAARRWGLIVSMTRLVHFGPLPEELRRKTRAVCGVDACFIAGTLPGADVARIFERGIAEYAAQGYPDEWRLHHQGGPTGYVGREYRATSKVRDTVRRNQAFAWNPSITGAKSEDTIIAGDAGPEIISAIDGWPAVEVEIDSRVLSRPDVLVV